MLNLHHTIAIVIDVQEKLVRAMHQRDILLSNLQKLLRGVRVLGLPTLWTEQNPDGLGPTIPELASLLSSTAPLRKMTFSCCGSPPFLRQLQQIQRTQIVIAGIETHVCVYQTVLELLELRYEVHVVTDAVTSRTPENKQLALARMAEAGASLTSVEMALFELLRTAEGQQFKEILNIIK